MKSKTLALLVIVAGIIAFTMAGQSQKAPAAKEKVHRERQLPIVDFCQTPATDPNIFSKQRAKANRYDRQSSQPIKEAYLVEGRIWNSHWYKDLSALPFPQSDVVIIGGVTDAKAHLSNDKTGIYSEFSVQVEEVISNAAQAPVNAGNMLALERFGGAVRFPSGVIQKYETIGQGMPSAGQRYLFFLKHIDEANYKIVTGYQLDGQVVSPLDGTVVEQGNGVYPFDVYQGFDVTTFLQIVKTEASQKTKS
ncbi:MAG: hypothetical protein WAL47_19845 [Pyrinomonadaceae bacterium]